MRTGPNPETRWRMRLVRPGLIEYEATFGDRIDDDREILVAGELLEALVVRNLERMATILIDLGLGGPAFVSIALKGTEDIILTRAHFSGRPIRTPSFVLPTAEIADLSKPMADALHEQFDILWQTSGWGDGSPSFGFGTWQVQSKDER